MKQAIIIFTLLSTIFITNAQTSITAYTDCMDHIIHTSIKEYVYPETIRCSLVDSTTGNYKTVFSHQYDSPMSTHSITLPGYVVTDFKVTNDSVFFCGYYYDATRGGDYGFIGLFDIDDLFHNGGLFYIHRLFKTYEFDDPYYVTRLTKLVTYRDQQNVRHVVSIGYTNIDEHEYEYACMIDLYRPFDPVPGKETDSLRPPVSPWFYDSGVLYKTPKKCMLDIIQAGGWLVTAGFNETMNRICLRVYDPQNVFSSSGLQDIEVANNNQDPSYSGPRMWNTDQILLAYQHHDTIATAATWTHHDETHRFARNINIAQFSLNQLTGSLGNTMVSLNEYLFEGYGDEVSLQGFLGNWRTRRIALIFELKKLGGGVHSLFWESNFKQNYCHGFSNYDYSMGDDRGIGGFDIFNTNQYVMAGRNTHNISWYNYRVETAGMISLCQPEVRCRKVSYPVFSAIAIHNSFIRLNGESNVLAVEKTVNVTFDIEIECEQ